MLKRIFIIILLLLTAGYWVLALTVLNRKPEHEVCKRMELLQSGGEYTAVVTHDDVASLLRKHSLYPVGKKMDEIRTDQLEKQLENYPLVERAECYKSPGGTLCVQVIQRVPVLHVINDKGEDFYLDDKGKVMPSEVGFVAHLPIVTGHADKNFVQKSLYPLGLYIKNEPFWDSQIEQIHVSPLREIELVPRVGNHIVFLGKAEHFEEKLENLKIFYEKALNRVGWNKYSRINLEFTNQIICTKKE